MRLIDADKLKSDFNMGEECDTCKQNTRSCKYDRNYSLMDFCGWIDDQPTVEPEREKGRWLSVFDEEESKCSECGSEFYYPKERGYNFCPNCGADMRG